MSTIKPHKMRKPAAIYRLIQRKVRGELKSPFWQVRVRISKGCYKQKSSNTVHRAAAREFARCWIAQDFEHVWRPAPPRCVTARQHRLPRAQCAA